MLLVRTSLSPSRAQNASELRLARRLPQTDRGPCGGRAGRGARLPSSSSSSSVPCSLGGHSRTQGPAGRRAPRGARPCRPARGALAPRLRAGLCAGLPGNSGPPSGGWRGVPSPAQNAGRGSGPPDVIKAPGAARARRVGLRCHRRRGLSDAARQVRGPGSDTAGGLRRAVGPLGGRCEGRAALGGRARGGGTVPGGEGGDGLGECLVEGRIYRP